MPPRKPIERRSVTTRSIARGTLGEASDSEVSTQPYSRIDNPYAIPPSTSRQALERGDLVLREVQNEQSERQEAQLALRGAARRKQKSYRQRQIADLRKMLKLQKNTSMF